MPCSDLSAAGWITSSTLPWDQLVTFGPSGFPAYARLLVLPDPQFAGQSENDVPSDEERRSDREQLAAAVQVLRRHTRTPDDCYFCLWDGWGPGSSVPVSHDSHGLPTTYTDDGGRFVAFPSVAARPGVAEQSPASPPRRPKVVVPGRAYFLFRGKAEDLGAWGADGPWPDMSYVPEPAFVWPADHAWCIANDVDPHWMGIGASTSAIEALVADPVLDVVPADPAEEQPTYR